jgi:gliding motility-associated-like protein
VNGDTIYLTGLEARPTVGFTVRIRDSAPGGGCFVSKPLFIGGERAMTFDTVITDVACNGQSNGRISFTNVQGTPPFLVTINRASNGSQVFRDTIQIAGRFEVTSLSADVYNVTIIQPGQCGIQQTFSFEVKQPAPLAVNWRVTRTTDFGFSDGEITIDSISGGNRPYRAAFDFREFRNLNSDTIFRFLNLRCHNFQVIDDKGCQLETELCVTRDTVLLVPNIFTPNVDGANDKFIIRAIPNGTVFRVYTRWGRLVYRSTNYQNDWDGKDMNGNDIMDGVYFYEIDIPNVRKQKGWIQIQRW